ncbi:MAG: chemotaxis protein CheW [Desulfonatronovibrio sp.]
MKTPEQYFEEQEFDLGREDKPDSLSPKEKLFIDKYLGDANAEIQIPEVRNPEKAPPPVSEDKPVRQAAPETTPDTADKPRPKPAPVQKSVAPERKKESRPGLSDKKHLESLEEIQLISFFMRNQEYALPIEKVKEIIKYIQPTKLPSTPYYLDGVINLRHRVTPIVSLASLLSPDNARDSKNRFIVVCHHDGLQLGLLVERIATMYRMPQEDIEWNVESALAMNSSFVTALIKNREKIISILSIETIVNHLLAR